MARVADGPSPLLPLVLDAIGTGARPVDVSERLAALGITPAPGVVDGVIAEATSLGLTRVAAARPDADRFVLTSLGRRQLAAARLDPEDADRLRELETLRTDLAATIAHELRTPLTAIRTCAGLLLDETAHPTPEQHRTLVQTIERNAERMQRVVGDILDLARFRTGAIALQPRRFDAVAMADAVIGSLAPMAATRSVEVALEPAERALAIFGDHRRLEQALVNLLSNALRFAAEDGRVVVRVSRDGDRVRIAVTDDGPGIAHADQARLFERFFVGRSDVGGAREGVGLGLPTALAIAQAHAGTIEVDSAPGRGSTFSLVVPLDGPPDLPEVD